MKRMTLSYMAMLLGAIAGCGSDPAQTDKCAAITCSPGATCDAATGACVNPPVPSLASAPLIDRIGRPGVNTALTNPFDLYKPQNATNPEASNTTKDAYNTDIGNAASLWQNWAPAIRFHLGVFDVLDSTGATAATVTSNKCGNQLGYDAPGTSGYEFLSGLLAGDALQVDTSKTTCQQYLGAELAAVGVGSDCGGRTLDEDVIDVTYSALVTGPSPTGALNSVTDGIAKTTNSTAAFPFMAQPQ